VRRGRSDDVDGADRRVGGEPVGDRAVPGREHCRVRVVGTHDLRTGDLRQVAIEAGDDRVERSVVVEMVGLDVGQDRGVQRQLEMGAVALVGLDDEPLAAGPLRSGAHVVHVAADHEARTPTGVGEDQHQHRRRRRLAVRPRNGERARLGTDRRQHAGSGERRDAAPARLVELVEIERDRGRRRHRVAAVDM
jgi:hypothetical protein